MWSLGFPVALNVVGTDMGMMVAMQHQEKLGGAKAPLRFGLAALLIGNLCLAFGPVFVRMADTGPVASAFWRIALAIVPLFVIARMVGEPAKALPKAMVGLFAISGLVFAADLAAWHLGIVGTKLANANLLGNSTSFLLPLYAFVAARVWPTRMQGIALGLAMLGAGLLMGRSYELSPQNLIGDLLCILAGAFYTGYLVLMTRARETMPQWVVLAWSTLMSALPLLIIAWAMGERLWPSDWKPLLALTFFSQILGQGLMIYAIGRVAPILFGITLLIQPIISATYGWIVFGERLAGLDWIGAGLIAIALILVRGRD
jgi:drug/metabolite transporter (DMT)-like permease